MSDPSLMQMLIAVLGMIGSIVGASVGAYFTIKVHIAVLEQRMLAAESEIKSLRQFRHEALNRFAEAQLAELKRGKP